MTDIYATPEADLGRQAGGVRDGGNIDDAIAGNIEVGMLETMGEAWRGMKGFKLKCHIATVLWFLVYLGAAMLSIPIMLGMLALGADEISASLLSSLLQIIAVTATMPMLAGITIMAIRHSRDKSVSAGMVFRYFHRIPGVLLWYLLFSILVTIGYLLLILPGIYLSFAYMFSLPLMIEKDMGAWQALEVSRKAVTRLWFRATGFLLLVVLLIIIGTIPLGIPLIWIIPWTTLAYALIYFKLFGAEAETLAD